MSSTDLDAARLGDGAHRSRPITINYRPFTDFRPKSEILAEARPNRPLSAAQQGTRQPRRAEARVQSLFVLARQQPPSTTRGPAIYAAQLHDNRGRPARGLRGDESKHHMTTSRRCGGYKRPRARRGGGRGREDHSERSQELL